MKNIFLTILILTFFPIATYATEETPLSELFSRSEVKAAEIEEMDNKEQERLKGFENQLGFTLPAYTDNPSYVITFSDPSPDQKGVQLEIDGKSYIDIKSPYTFPALSIGQHTLKFRFYDKDGNVQVLEYDLIVLPRAPLIKPPVFDTTKISIAGTGLSNSEVIVFISANTFNTSKITTTNNNGEWALDIEPEMGLANGIYTITAYSRKYGFASALSNPVVFEIGNSKSSNIQEKKDIFFSFASIDGNNFSSVVSQNSDLLFLVLAPLALGILLTLGLKSIIDRKKTEKFERKAEKVINVQNRNSDKTLRELFESKPVKSVPIEKKPTQKEDRVISKEDFLKEYKSVDPDDKSGKENPKPKEKREVTISLTSHEEL
jgi:hypothetical protein